MDNRLHQLNISYSKREDRLLLRVNTHSGEEYQVWITRRYAARLLELLTQEMDKQGGVTAVASSPSAKTGLRKGSFEKRFSEPTKLPFGDEAILAHGLKAVKSKAGNLRLSILPERGSGLTLNLTKHLLYVFHDLLIQAINTTDWRLVVEQSAASARIH